MDEIQEAYEKIIEGYGPGLNRGAGPQGAGVSRGRASTLTKGDIDFQPTDDVDDLTGKKMPDEKPDDSEEKDDEKTDKEKDSEETDDEKEPKESFGSDGKNLEKFLSRELKELLTAFSNRSDSGVNEAVRKMIKKVKDIE
jgi:predicted transcriptional regulator